MPLRIVHGVVTANRDVPTQNCLSEFIAAAHIQHSGICEGFPAREQRDAIQQLTTGRQIVGQLAYSTAAL